MAEDDASGDFENANIQEMFQNLFLRYLSFEQATYVGFGTSQKKIP